MGSVSVLQLRASRQRNALRALYRHRREMDQVCTKSNRRMIFARDTDAILLSSCFGTSIQLIPFCISNSMLLVLNLI